MEKKKILIIEDDANIASGLEANFRLNGMEVEVNYGNGSIEETLTYLKHNPKDIVVLDLILPGMDGIKLLKEIKSNEDLSGLLVIVFSDFSEADIKARCDNLGADYFYLKQDFQVKEFTDKISKIIKNKHLKV
jgi:DNA-binding response OmpR family regulator